MIYSGRHSVVLLWIAAGLRRWPRLRPCRHRHHAGWSWKAAERRRWREERLVFVDVKVDGNPNMFTRCQIRGGSMDEM